MSNAKSNPKTKVQMSKNTKYNTRYKIQDTRYKHSRFAHINALMCLKIKNLSVYLKIKNYKIKNWKFRKAQSLMEILVAIAVGTILIGGSAGLMTAALRGYRVFKRQLQASSLGKEGMEIVQALARSNWHSVADLTPGIHYKFVPRGNSYVPQKGEEKVFDDTGLVAYWNFDEATSTIAYDDSGNTNNGTLTNGPTWHSGSDCVSGSCLSFDGSDDYVNIGDKSNLEGFSQLSISAWIKPGDLSGNHFIAGKEGIYKIDTSGNRVRFLTGNDWAGSILTSQTTLSANEWYYIAATYDGSIKKLYINGIQDSNTVSTSGSVGTNSNIASIGFLNGSSDYFNGLIDEVRIYNRALSADEIKQHYQAGLDKLGLVSYWAMDEDGGTTAYDSQSTNNGTLYNGPTWHSGSDCASGSCLSFDGSDDYVEIPYNSSLYLDGTNESVLLWVKHNSNYILFQNNGWSRRLFSNIWVLIDVNGDYHYLSAAGSNDNQWHLVAYTFSNGEIKSYVDGKLMETESSADLKPASSYWWLGRLCSGSSCDDYFNGLIDEVRIYNRALSADEIEHHYEAGYTRYLVLNKVSRTSGTIDSTYSSANDDPGTLKVSSILKYGRGLVSNQRGGMQQLNTYLTRSADSKVFAQTDWSGGSGQSGPIPAPNNKYDSATNINDSATGQITMATTTSDAILTSSIFDTGVSGGAGFNSLLWQGSLGTNGVVKFQIAFSNSSSGPWTYYGPTSSSDYYQPNPGVSIPFSTTGTASPQNRRYIRYQVTLSTSGTTPQVDDIIINWSP